MSEMLVFMLIISGLGQFLQAPPRDAASLMEPKAALEQMQVATDEDSLIALLKTDKKAVPSKAELLKAVDALGADDFKTRRAAKKLLVEHGKSIMPELTKAASAKDPEKKENAQEVLDTMANRQRAKLMAGDNDYVKKLMAIYMLGSLKSTKAIATLKTISDGEVVTLADAAAVALATIANKPAPRPEVTPMLMDIASRLPGNTGFAAMLDFTTDSRLVSMATLMTAIKTSPIIKDGPVPPQQLDAMMQQLPAGMAKLLGMAGNVRIDAVAAIFPDRLGMTSAENYVALVVKGLYEPMKVEGLLNMEMQASKSHGKTIYTSHEMGICCWDAHTFIFVPCDQNDGRAIERFLADYANPKKGATIETLTAAHPLVMPGLVPVLNGKARLAAGGGLSSAQRAMAKGEMAKELARMKGRNRQGPDAALQKAALEMVLEVVSVPNFSGQIGRDGKLTISGKMADKAAADKVKNTLDAFDKALLEMMNKAKEAVQEDKMATKMIDDLVKKKGFFLATTSDTTVIIQNSVDSLLAFPMIFLVNARVARADAMQQMNAPHRH